MNRRLVSVLIFAVAVAGLTSFLVYRLILVRVQSQGRTVSTNKLLVAKHDLQVGDLIHDVDVDEVPWDAPMPDDAIKTRSDMVGRGVVATIFQNEPVLGRRLAAKGAGAGLAATIPMGMRAAALRVNEVVGLAGFVLPGMRVDVLIAGTVPGSLSTLSRTVLQNLEVLSAGQKIEKTADGKPESVQVVNLLVTPDEAEVLNLASSEARVQLVLRNPLDTKEEKTRGISLAQLYGVSESLLGSSQRMGDPPPPTVIRRARVAPVALTSPKPAVLSTVEVFNGSKKTQETFEPKGGVK